MYSAAAIYFIMKNEKNSYFKKCTVSDEGLTVTMIFRREQVTRHPVLTTANDFFEVNRQMVTTVRLLRVVHCPPSSFDQRRAALCA